MKIKVTSEDGMFTAEVETGDIDLEGHTMNRTILDYRFKQAVNAVYNYEHPPQPEPPRPAQVRQIKVDKNEAGRFEVWEPGACGNGHAALYATTDTVQQGVDEALRRVAGLRVRVVEQDKDHAVIEYQ